MKILVCGGRDYADRTMVFRALDKLLAERGVSEIIHGNARGADALAGAWAATRRIPCRAFPAEWERYGKAAGMKRNAQMLVEGRPDAIVAFPGGAGTFGMVLLAKRAGKPVWQPVKR